MQLNVVLVCMHYVVVLFGNDDLRIAAAEIFWFLYVVFDIELDKFGTSNILFTLN